MHPGCPLTDEVLVAGTPPSPATRTSSVRCWKSNRSTQCGGRFRATTEGRMSGGGGVSLNKSALTRGCGHVNDIFQVLGCALRSRYCAPEVLPTLPIWTRFPSELRSALAMAIERCEPLRSIERLVWQVSAELHGKPEEAGTSEWSRASASLILGLLYLAYQEGRIDTTELLTRAFHYTDSHVCNIDPRPFIRLRNELALSSVSTAVAELFAPYAQVAQQCVEHWGLR
jgi:hypothetical protein